MVLDVAVVTVDIFKLVLIDGLLPNLAPLVVRRIFVPVAIVSVVLAFLLASALGNILKQEI